jgi:cation diffusion facilitator family transporter
MADCCQNKACDITALRTTHARVLWIVLTINALMFVVEGVAGIAAHSTSLLADALDMLGDALVYGLSLVVLAQSARSQARVALIKGAFMFVFGIGVLAEAAHKVLFPAMPGAETMGAIGGVALAANFGCFVLLYRHRGDNLNMRSTWLCSRNDLLANAGVLMAAVATYAFASQWPDIVVGVAIAALFLRSAISVIVESLKALRAETTQPSQGGVSNIPITTSNPAPRR